MKKGVVLVAETIRVRFAPSPTGYLHLGSARTALFNWLHARRKNGKLILRIEDTDKERSKKEFLEEIMADLKWMGIDWDEGPFFQSEREGIYREKAESILKKGLAYREGNAIIYKVDKGKVIKINDMVHGEIAFNTDEIKDQVLLKSDGSAAYNFACVVDDNDMKITHIIRGDDHISNTPKQIMLYEALGMTPPTFAHMPLMMGKDGAKLSKRHGCVAVFEYKRDGFLPEALSNYLLLLGWSPKDGREIISLDEAAKEFDIKDIAYVQARFDMDKLRWINGEYIMRKGPEEILKLLKENAKGSGFDLEGADEAYLLKVVGLYRTRFKTLREFFELTDFFFKDDFSVEEKGANKYLSTDDNRHNVKILAEKLATIEPFTHMKIEEVCRALADEKGLKASRIIHPCRMAISGKTKGAGLFELMEVLGKKKVLERMNKL